MKLNFKRTNGNKNSQKNVNLKIFYIFITLVLFFCFIVAKLFYINIVEGETLTRSALNQLTSTEVVKADRGLIYDKNKKELVVNVTKSNIYYNMNFRKGDKYTEKELETKNKAVEEDSLAISKVLQIPYEELKQKFVGDKVVLIAANVDRDQAASLRSLGINKLIIDDVTRRYYPNNSMLSKVIGFVSDDGDGQYGLESSYDNEMSGISGKNISIKNNIKSQIPLTDEESYAPKEGKNLILTIDENIQKFAEDAAENSRLTHNAQEVDIIVQNTKTGQILAMASSQSYDANNPKKPVGDIQESEWDNLSDDEKVQTWYKNWTNFNVSSQYEPGSTFKLITSAAALEEATTYPLKEYYCPGVYTEIPGVKITCASKNMGNKSMEQAIIESCNISLIKIGRELGSEKFLKYIQAFGFGEKTGIDLPAEATGSIPKTAKEITPIRLATMSYGHGIAVTPIQLINSVSAIANGGQLKVPRIVDRVEDNDGNIIKKYEPITKRQVISPETSKTMLDIMYKVVEQGTGKNARVEGYKVGGKTGTANVPSEAGGYEEEYISSFVGVAPIDNPEITVLVIVQKPKGDFFAATVATPAAGEVIKKSLEYLGIEKNNTTAEVKTTQEIVVPELKNMLVADAGKELVSNGLRFNTNRDEISNDSVVIKQEPAAGTVVSEDTIIDLFVSSKDEKVMPNLVGKTKSEIESVLQELNVVYNVNGSGVVLEQSIAPGTKLTKTSTIDFKMSQEEKTNDSASETDKENTDVKETNKNTQK